MMENLGILIQQPEDGYLIRTKVKKGVLHMYVHKMIDDLEIVPPRYTLGYNFLILDLDLGKE